MAEVKLIYFAGCPNADRARENLAAAGVAFDIVRQDDLPPGDSLRTYSSPSILKGDEIVFGSRTESNGGGCSLKIPSVAELRERFGESREPKKARVAAQIGSIGSALTVGLCPVCIPAIGAFLSAVGLGFLVRESVLRPVLIVFLLLTVGGLLWSYVKEHGNVLPVLLGALLAAGLYVGRYVYLGSEVNTALMWGSIAGLLTVSVWNLRLRKQRSYPACATDAEGLSEKAGNNS